MPMTPNSAMQNMNIPNQMGIPIPNQMPNQLNPQMGQQMQNSVPNQMGGPQMQGQMISQMQIPNQMQPNMGNALGNQMPPQIMGGGQIPKPHQGIMPPMMPNFAARNPTPPQIFNQSPSPSVQSPAGLSGQQPVASPALAPSPGSQMSMIGSVGPPRSVGLAASPSSLNTPGQPNQSPMGSMQEEQAYREKVRQLSKYIEPLRKMIARIGNDGKVNKMNLVSDF